MIVARSFTRRSLTIPRRLGPYNSCETRFPGTKLLGIFFATAIMHSTVCECHSDGDSRSADGAAFSRANAYLERFIGSVRRECLDHVVVLTALGLRRILMEYVAYYSRSRTHLGLSKDAPISRPVAPATAGPVAAISQVGGLHHRYERRAA